MADLSESTLLPFGDTPYCITATQHSTDQDLEDSTARFEMISVNGTIVLTDASGLTKSTNTAASQVWDFSVTEGHKTTLLGSSSQVRVKWKATITYGSSATSGPAGENYNGFFLLSGPAEEATPDTTAPTAVLVGSLPGSAVENTAFDVVVDFTDDTSFNDSSVTTSSLTAVDGATNATVTLSTASITNGVRATFSVTAPSAGTYTITVPASSYSDAAGNQGAEVSLGSVVVNAAGSSLSVPIMVGAGVL